VPIVPEAGAGDSTSSSSDSLTSYLQECRELVLQEIAQIIPAARHGQRLYELMRDYPLRGGKALRPALCIATCRALGGHLESVLRSAAAIELYHNAFLVHDDVEDRSELRRAEPTLHRKYGVPIAVNVGDGMLALSMSSLLANTDLIGVGKALRALETVGRMATESAEGQMIELDWISRGSWTLTDQSYVRMVYKKTTWYSFITPVQVGAIAAGASRERIHEFGRFASLLGVAFQIQDDVLNLAGQAGEYGKEIAGDLWEGKHTLILIHAMRCAREGERVEAARILRKPRPVQSGQTDERERALETLQRLRARGALSPDEDTQLTAAIGAPAGSPACKTRKDVQFLLELLTRYDGIGYASRVAERRAARAARCFGRIERGLARSAHADFLRDLVEFVIKRTR
jgi:geranylgeranyl diphosphate synthase type II